MLLGESDDSAANIVGAPTGRAEPPATSMPLDLTSEEHLEQARRLLDEVWGPAERGPYPLFAADAFNLLTEIEIAAGQTQAATDAARTAFRLSWLQGPPFAYARGLAQAAEHLDALGADPPDDLPPYDESQYDPMPEIEIDPRDLPIEIDDEPD